MAALNTLDIDDIRLLKSLGKPPDDVGMVTATVMILTSTRGVPKDVSWLAAKNNLMKNPK
jgi:Microtubule-binding stalk of dynein motor